MNTIINHVKSILKKYIKLKNKQKEILNKIYVSKSYMDEDMLEKAKEII